MENFFTSLLDMVEFKQQQPIPHDYYADQTLHTISQGIHPPKSIVDHSGGGISNPINPERQIVVPIGLHSKHNLFFPRQKQIMQFPNYPSGTKIKVLFEQERM